MLAYPVLLIFLLAGYLPMLLIPTLRFRLAAINGWRLLLETLAIGVSWTILAGVAAALVPAVFDWAEWLTRESDPYLGVFMQSSDQLPAGVILAAPLSLGVSLVTWGIQRWGIGEQRIAAGLAGPMHETLLASLRGERVPLMVTMSWGKVYVGKVVRLPPPAAALNGKGSLRIVPMLSGYRDKDDRTVTLTEDYLAAIAAWRASEAAHDPRPVGESFALDLRYEDIESVRRFETNLFKRFQTDRVSASPSADADVMPEQG